MPAMFTINNVTDNLVIITDFGQGKSVTNDAPQVIHTLSEHLGGLGRRKVYYLDTMGRYDELKHENESFTGFAPCSDSQQKFLGRIANET